MAVSLSPVTMRSSRWNVDGGVRTRSKQARVQDAYSAVSPAVQATVNHRYGQKRKGARLSRAAIQGRNSADSKRRGTPRFARVPQKFDSFKLLPYRIFRCRKTPKLANGRYLTKVNRIA